MNTNLEIKLVHFLFDVTIDFEQTSYTFNPKKAGILSKFQLKPIIRERLPLGHHAKHFLRYFWPIHILFHQS